MQCWSGAAKASLCGPFRHERRPTAYYRWGRRIAAQATDGRISASRKGSSAVMSRRAVQQTSQDMRRLVLLFFPRGVARRWGGRRLEDESPRTGRELGSDASWWARGGECRWFEAGWSLTESFGRVGSCSPRRVRTPRPFDQSSSAKICWEPAAIERLTRREWRRRPTLLAGISQGFPVQILRHFHILAPARIPDPFT